MSRKDAKDAKRRKEEKKGIKKGIRHFLCLCTPEFVIIFSLLSFFASSALAASLRFSPVSVPRRDPILAHFLRQSEYALAEDVLLYLG